MGALMALSDIAERFGLGVHMDGYRLMNAVVASGISAREYASTADSIHQLLIDSRLGAKAASS